MRHVLERQWRKIALVIAIALIIIFETLFLTADHWWRELGEARITYNGQLAGTFLLSRG